MKKSRITALILAMVMLVSCIASTTSFVSAAEGPATASASAPAIISYNVAYGSYFYMEAAISTASVGGEGKTVTVNLYDSAEATKAVANTVAVYTTEDLPAYFGGSAYTATIPYAISFADTAKEFYIEAECDGAKSDRVKYSIVEYCLQRLYKDGVTGDQKELCENTLNFAASIDKLDKTKENTALDYRYVAVKKDGAVNGTRAAIVVNGNTASVTVNAGATVTDWTVTTVKADGTSTVSEMSAADAAAGFEVSGNMIFEPKAAPIVAAPGTYFDVLGGYTFDDESMLSMNNKGYSFGASQSANDQTYCSGTSYVVYDASSYNQSIGQRHIYMNLVENPKDAADKVLRFHKYGAKDNTQAWVTNKNNEYKTGNTFVFETDIYIHSDIAETYGSSYIGGTTPYIFTFYLGSSAEVAGKSTADKTAWNLSQVLGAGYISAFREEDGTLSYYLTGKQNDKGLSGIGLKPENWYTITFEMYYNEDNQFCGNYYVNGTKVFDYIFRDLTTVYDLSTFDSVGILTRGAYARDGFGAYLDDTFVGILNK